MENVFLGTYIQVGTQLCVRLMEAIFSYVCESGQVLDLMRMILNFLT